MKVYFDISSMLDEFYKKAKFMSTENLIESSNLLKNFLNKYIDNNSDLFKKGLDVMIKLYQAMGENLLETYSTYKKVSG
jgi:hypothetical protein